MKSKRTPRVHFPQMLHLALPSPVGRTSSLLLTSLAVLSLPMAHAADATWLANPTSGQWFTNENWSPAAFPNGLNDTATFGSSSQTAIFQENGIGLDKIVFTNTASAYTFTVDSPWFMQYTGAGVVNNSGVAQNFIVKGGTSSNTGVLIFFNSSTVTGQTIINAGPANLVGGLSGAVQFSDTSSAGTATLSAQASLVGGISGGQVSFFNQASGGNSFITNQGTAVFLNNFVSSGRTVFNGNSTGGNATILNGATNGIISVGGRTNFRENASAGAATITNQGASTNNSAGGSTYFEDQATASTATINNQASSGISTIAAQTVFNDQSSAGSAAINNIGTTTFNTFSGSTVFQNSSTAASAIIRNEASTAGQTQAGATEFKNTSSAGNATITNFHGTVNGSGGGFTNFTGNSTAGTATITSQGGTATAIVAIGKTVFSDSATAGTAQITTLGGNGSAAIGSNLTFSNTSSGGNGTFTLGAGQTAVSFGGLATFENQSTLSNGKLIVQAAGVAGAAGAIANFIDTASAGAGKIEVYSPAVSGVFSGAGQVIFENQSTAATSKIDVYGTGLFSNSQRGSAYFRDSSTAAAATIHLHTGGGTTIFSETAGAGTAAFTIDGTLAGSSGRAEIGFSENSTANQATFTNLGAGVGSTLGGSIGFYGSATAAQAQIQNQGGTVASANGATNTFQGTSTAASAKITNEGSAFSNGPFFGGGNVQFFDTATAANSIITNNGGTAAGGTGGLALFYGNSTAGSATITSNGGTVAGAKGGQTLFTGTQGADNATLITNGGLGEGGLTQFNFTSNGGSARAITNAGGFFDISGLSNSGMGIGSIEGAGTYQLGNKTLTTGSLGTSTEVSGSITDGGSVSFLHDGPYDAVGGSLTKIGNGTLTLSGNSTYTGSTTISAGKMLVNGSLANTATSVASGATLGGSGSISGTVTVANGGILAPGNSPGTLTLGSLVLNSSSILSYELNAANSIGNPANDLININGNFTLDGLLNVTTTGSFSSGTYRLFNYSGDLTNNNLAINSLPSGFDLASFAVQTAVAGQINLIVVGGAISYWDGANTVVNNLVDGGTSVWDSTSTNWTNASGTTNSIWDGDRAIFSGAAGKVTVAENISAKEIRFLTSAYNISVESTFGPISLTIDGIGVVNNSGITQNFQTAANGKRANLEFINQANAGSNTNYTNYGDQTALSQLGALTFNDTSSAGSSTIINRGGDYVSASAVPGFIGGFGGSTTFTDSSTAANATILNYAGTVGGAVINTETMLVGGGALGGGTTFLETATASNATITNYGGTALNASGGTTTFLGSATAANSTITNKGADAANSGRGTSRFSGNSTAANAALIAESGTNGGLGGLVEFSSAASGGSAKAVANAGSLFDFTFLSSAGTTLGSIEGAGTFDFAGKNLSVGSLNTSTEVSGILKGAGGSLTKVGSGTLTLSGNSIYTGSTTVSVGKLLVNGSLANTATSVASGATLGGSGNIGGAVTVQNGGILAPGTSPGTLTVASLTLNSSSILDFELNIANSIGNAANDLVNVDGDLTLDGILKVTSGGSFSAGSYRLFNYGGDLVNNGLTILTLPSGFNPGDFSIDLTQASQVILTNGGGGGGGGGNGLQYWDGSQPTPDSQISGGNGTWNNSATNWTNAAGDINGPWASEKAIFSATPGTVTLGADISFQELFFTVDGYIIKPGSGYLLKPTGEAKIDVAAHARTILEAALSTNDRLEKSGAGSLVLAATAPSTLANLAVNEGSFYLNSPLTTATATVAAAATLGGNSTLTGNVENSGTLAPGNSVGTLTVSGDYEQTSSGDFALEVDSLASFDSLNITGDAKLAGTLSGIQLAHRFAFGDLFTFLQAAEIEGKFSSIILPDPNRLRGRFLVDPGSGSQPDTGSLLIAPTSYTLVAVNQNQRNLATALDTWIGIETGDVGAITLSLDLLRSEQYPNAFEAMLPGIYQAALQTNLELSQNHLQLLHQMLSARRLASRALPATATSESSSKNAAPAPPAAPRWNSWAIGSGLYASDGLSSLPGENFQSGTLLAGADYQLSEHFALGLFTSFQDGSGDYPAGGEFDLQSTRLGLYGTADFGPLYMNAAIGLGKTDYSIRRNLQWSTLDRQASSTPSGTEFFAEWGTGYDFTAGNWTFGPQLNLRYSRLKLDQVRESGADSLDLALDDATASSLRSQLGGRLAYTWHLSPRLAIIPEVRAFWQHEYLAASSHLAASLDNGNGPNFSYQSQDPQRDSLFIGAGVGLQLDSNLHASLYYHADIGRSEQTNQTLSLSVNWKF